MFSALNPFRRLILLVTIGFTACSATSAGADILPPQQGIDQQFGNALAYTTLGSTEYLAIGSAGMATASNLIRVYRRSSLSNSWALETSLSASAGIGIRNEHALAMRAGPDGTILLVVGLPQANFATGRAHVFRRGIDGNWAAEGSIARTDGVTGDYFGAAVAIAPDLSQIAIAAPFDNPTGCGGMSPACASPPGFGRGVVSVFKREPTGLFGTLTWILKSVASAPIEADLYEQLGTSLAYAGTATSPIELLIGAPGWAPGLVGPRGQVFVVQQDAPNSWFLADSIVFPKGSALQGVRGLGHSMQAVGAAAVVGAPFTDPTNGGGGLAESGAAFLLRKTSDSGWSVGSELIVPDVAGRRFGISVGMEGDRLAVGTAASEVFLFRGTGCADFGCLALETLLYPTSQSPNPTDGFGESVALGTDTVAIGMINRDGQEPDSGAVCIFDAFGGKFTSSDPDTFASFGEAVAVGDQRAIVGAGGFDGSQNNEGRIEIFERSTRGWTRIETARATDPSASAFAGRSVAIADDAQRISFGAPGAAQSAGAVYGGVTTFAGSPVYTISKLTFASAIATAQVGERLGVSVGMTNQGGTRWIVAGAPGFDIGGVSDRGRVLVWRNDVMHQAIVGPAIQSDTGFGDSVAIESYTDGTVDLVVGAPSEDVSTPGSIATNCGSIYIYRKSPTATNFSLLLSAQRHGSAITNGDYGARLALKKSRLAVGCPSRDVAGVDDVGAVFAWTRSTSGTWVKVTNGFVGLEANERFGSGVSTDGTNVLAGAPGSSNGNPQSSVGVARLLAVSGISLVVSQTFSSTDSKSQDGYGSAVAIGTATNSPVVIGCSNDSNGDRIGAGSAHGFLGPGNACAGDIDGDFEAGASDLSLLLGFWGVAGESSMGADINIDGVVDAGDLSLLLAGWGVCGE